MYLFIYLLLCVIYMGISFTGLLSRKLNFSFYLILFIHLLIINAILGTFMGQFVTIPLVLGAITIVYLGCNRSILDALFSLTGYLLGILANHLCSIPLSMLGYPLELVAAQHPYAFLLSVITITLLLQFFIKKYFLRPKLTFLQQCPRKLQWVFLLQLLVCVGLIAVNFVYGEYTGYPAEVLTFNGLIIAIFTAFTVALFYALYQILQENYELKLRQKEQELWNDYTTKIEEFYEEFRIFRHDYKNILSTLDYYIKEKDMVQLQNYFQEKILPSGEVLSSDHFAIGKLHLIEIPAVKSILYTKLLAALNQGLSLTLEITEPLTAVNMDELDLSRILGILIDNALEAAIETEDRILSIAIINSELSVIFSITNSCLPPEVPLTKLTEKGYSGKKQHDGLGLYTVRNIIDSKDNVSYLMQYDGVFRQTLEIGRNE